jgi:hypothetical protein
MGYRSEVILAIGPDIVPHFMTLMARCPQARELCWSQSSELIKDYAAIEGALCFRWASIKWYESYVGVRAIQQFLSWCEDEGPDGIDATEHFRFVRIGEEMDDTTLLGYGFSIHVERVISY